MSKFTDHLKRDWTVELDGPLILAVRKECGVDLMKGASYEQLFGDHLLLADVLAVLCREQIQRSGMTADQFRAGVKSDAIDSGREAVKLAQVDFFPSRERDVLTAVAARMDQMRQTALAEDLERVNSPETERRIMEALRKGQDAALEKALTLLSSGMSLPESSASPAVERSAN